MVGRAPFQLFIKEIKNLETGHHRYFLDIFTASFTLVTDYLTITVRKKMEEKDDISGWTKPKQSFRLKRTISRKRPGFDNPINKTLPERSQPVKRKQPCDEADLGVGSQLGESLNHVRHDGT